MLTAYYASLPLPDPHVALILILQRSRGLESVGDLPQATWILCGRARLEADSGLFSAAYSWVQEGHSYGGGRRRVTTL